MSGRPSRCDPRAAGSRDSGLSARRVLAVAIVLGLIHGVVDASSVGLLVRQQQFAFTSGIGEAPLLAPDVTVWDLFLLYNALAFGTQFSIGAVADRWRAYRATTLLALTMLAGAVAIGSAAPLAAVILAGVGNAAFHVGAGAVVLRLSPNRATPAGVFVGPGAVGLAFGLWAGQSLDAWPTISFGLLLASTGVVCWLGDAGQRRAPIRQPRPASIGRTLLVVCVSVLLVSIAIRSAAGILVVRVHEGEIGVLWGLAIAACLGKVVGGPVSDRLGWIKVSVLALLLSAGLLSLLVGEAAAAVVGMVLFQMTMPVTLLAVYRALPREPGLAFGLTTLALLLGAAPLFVLRADWLTSSPLLLTLILVSAAALVVGLPPVLRTTKTVRSRL